MKRDQLMILWISSRESNAGGDPFTMTSTDYRDESLSGSILIIFSYYYNYVSNSFTSLFQRSYYISLCPQIRLDWNGTIPQPFLPNRACFLNFARVNPISMSLRTRHEATRV